MDWIRLWGARGSGWGTLRFHDALRNDKATDTSIDFYFLFLAGP